MLVDKPKSNEAKPEATESDFTGRAFRRSLLAIAVLAIAIGAAVVWHNQQPGRTSINGSSATPATTSAKVAGEIPLARFTDITAEAGIRFQHYNGAYGEKLLPETMGGGVAFFDYDNDGRPDLLFVSSTDWPWHPGGAPHTLALYHNEGQGHFSDVTTASGLDISLYGMGI